MTTPYDAVHGRILIGGTAGVVALDLNLNPLREGQPHMTPQAPVIVSSESPFASAVTALVRRVCSGRISLMFEKKLAALSQMMAEHMAMPFPPGFRGLNIEDQDMVTLGADTYGYCLGVLKGPLDEHRGRGLIRLTAVFEGVLAAIDDEYATRYYAHVRDMAVLAAEIETLREK